MKIALVLSSPPGYSETFFNSKINGLKNNGVTVTLVTAATNEKYKNTHHIFHPKVYNNKAKQLFFMGMKYLTLLPYFKKVVTYYNLEKKEGTSTKRILEKIYLNATLLQLKVDGLHFGFATQAIDREFVAQAIGAKMGVSFRGFDLNVYPLKHPDCYRLLWQQVHSVHSISKYLLEKGYGLGLSKQTPFTIITPAIEGKRLPEVVPVQLQTPIKIVTIARLNWVKGIGVALSALSILKKQGISFTYHIIGTGTQAEQERYQFQVYELGLQNEVFFEGKLAHEQAIKLLNEATIYLQTSVTEGFCNAVLEAQALGKICVVGAVGGLPENVLDGETGYLVKDPSPEGYALKIAEVLKTPVSQLNLLSKAAQKRVQEEFSVTKQQRQFLEFFSDTP